MRAMRTLVVGLVVLALVAPARAQVAFREVGREAGVAKAGDAGAVAWFDFDGDGDEDLFVANLGKDKLYRNDGGTFAKAKRAGIGSGAISFGVAIGDYDNDGLLDVFVANQQAANALYRNTGGGRFSDVTREAGVGGGGVGSYSAAWADFDRDGLLDLFVANGSQLAGARDFLYRNLGDGRFAEVGERAGITGADRSLGCAWGDYDGDGWPDLFVANFGERNRLYRNRGDGTFDDRATPAGVAGPANGAGGAWGDFDNDGRLDLYVVNTNSGDDEDRLYRNVDGARFEDVTRQAGLFAHEDGEAAFWADLDNDGWLDLFLANRSDYAGGRREPNRLFRNLGGGAFLEIAAAAGTVGNGQAQPAAFADYDGDGRLDVFVGCLPATDLLFRNESVAGNALVVRLRGRESNRAAIGARVFASIGGMTLMREVSSSSGRSSQNQLAPHFGLGVSGVVDRLEVRWPSGRVQVLEGVAAGVVVVEEPAGDAR